MTANRIHCTDRILPCHLPRNGHKSLRFRIRGMRRNSLTEVYRSHPVFRDLRAPELFKGKCGICEFRNICGGSRARAYAMTGDYLAEEPFCAYEPKVQNAETAAALLTP